MAKEDLIEFAGVVSELLPNATFRVKLDNDHEIFAHTSGETLFGAERSLMDVIARLAREGLCPIVVLPALRNPAYLERVLEISAAVEVLPQIWRNGLYPPNAHTIDTIRALIRKHCPREIHVNTVVQEAPLIAARAEAVPSVVYVREMPAEDSALCRALGMSAEALRRQLQDQADRFVMPSQVVVDWLGCLDRSTVRPNAVDEALFDLPFAPGRYLIVALISSNIAKKGIADCVAAARMVAATPKPMTERRALIRMKFSTPTSASVQPCRVIVSCPPAAL